MPIRHVLRQALTERECVCSIRKDKSSMHGILFENYGFRGELLDSRTSRSGQSLTLSTVTILEIIVRIAELIWRLDKLCRIFNKASLVDKLRTSVKTDIR